MADLIARTPLDGLLPVRHGSVEATEVVHDAITSISPLKGRKDEIADLLESRFGLSFPGPGGVVENGGTCAVWTGLEQCFILGARLETLPGAAVTDQTDAWACASLTGADASAVLARLVPVDLGPDAFPVGSAARTSLGHMNCIVIRAGDTRYELLVFRSMAASAAHELERAMRMVAARAAV